MIEEVYKPPQMLADIELSEDVRYLLEVERKRSFEQGVMACKIGDRVLVFTCGVVFHWVFTIVFLNWPSITSFLNSLQ